MSLFTRLVSAGNESDPQMPVSAATAVSAPRMSSLTPLSYTYAEGARGSGEREFERPGDGVRS